MKRLTLETLVDRLGRLRHDEVTVPLVQELLGDGALDDPALDHYIGARPDKYARRLVHRGPLFDVMVLTWAPGQFTPVHNHAGNCGWVRLLRGQISEQTFKLVPGSALPNAAVCGSVDGKVGKIGLEATGEGVISTIGAVATVDRQRAIHRLGNPGTDTTVTLHVYSLPHDSCLAFDLEQRTCERRDMVFDAAMA